MSNALGIEEEYFLELVDLLNEVEECMLVLEKSYDDTQYKRVNRCLHSLKGNCGMIGLFSLEKVFHQTETHFLNNFSDKSNNCEIYLNIVDNVRDYYSSINEEKLEDCLRLINSKIEVTDSIEKENENRFSLKIYHLDDDEDMLYFLKETLENYGCEVSSFKNLDEMKKVILTGQVPDLFIVDFRMPDINGNTVISILASILPKVPRVLLSGQISKENIIEAFGHGALCVLEKPIDLYFLEKMLNRANIVVQTNRTLVKLRNILDEIENISDSDLRTRLSLIKLDNF